MKTSMCVDCEQLLWLFIYFDLNVCVCEVDMRKIMATVEFRENMFGLRQSILVKIQNVIESG